MKKTFTLTHPKIKYDRLIDAAKNDVRKYLKRESNKKLPEDVDFWDFDCRFGPDNETAKPILPAEIIKSIGEAGAENLQSFYLEILAKPGHRTKKPDTL